jgi:hypothetical protein
MQTLLFSICGLGIAGLSSLIYAAFYAPEAVEDERGFHLLDPVKSTRDVYTPPLTLSEGDVVFFK